MKRFEMWRSLALAAALLVAGFVNEAHAGSIGLMAAGAEDPMMNAFCTGSGAPAACCTGSGTGTCGSINAICTASSTPISCCTGSGTGSCTAITNTAPRTQYAGSQNRYIAADFGAPQSGGDRCVLWHFPMPPDYAGTEIKWHLNQYISAAPAVQQAAWRVDWMYTASASPAAYRTNVTFTAGNPNTFALLGTTIGDAALLSCTASNCIAGETSTPAKAPVTVRLCRTQTSADTYTATISSLDLTLEY